MFTLRFIAVCAAALVMTACQTVHKSKGRVVNYEKSGEVYIYESWELPEYLSPPPNDATLNYYFNKLQSSAHTSSRYWVQTPEQSSVQFDKKLEKSAFLEEQLRSTGLLSYLYYEDGIIKYDAIAPKERFDIKIDNTTLFRSASAGKSIVSLLAAHAICSGYIQSVDSPLSDWPLMSDTLYGKLRLVDVLDMRAGDKEFVSEDTGVQPTKRWYNSFSLTSFAQNELKGTEPSNNRNHYYNGLATNVALNYVIFKTGESWQKFLERVFIEDIGVENQVLIRKINGRASREDGLGTYGFNLSRYDYLRLGKSLLEHWNNNTCVGNYLKETFDRRVSKGVYPLPADGIHSGHRSSETYAGQFHFDYLGLKDQNIMGLYGYGGQTVLIDFDKSRIVVMNALHSDFNWKRLATDVIKHGQIK